MNEVSIIINGVRYMLHKKGYCTLIYETNFPDGKDYANSWRVNNTYNTYEEAAVAGIEYVVNNLI